MRAGFLKEWKKKNPEKMAGYAKKAREKRKEDPERLRKHKEYVKQSRNKMGQELKLEAFSIYGGPWCKCCKETRLPFLTLDHVNGGGNSMRKKNKINGSTAMYRWLKKEEYPEGYQVLCFNCNVGRHLNGGVCPHEEERGKQ